MTSLHIGHKTEERLECIDNMLSICEDTKDTVLQAFWWYRKYTKVKLEKLEKIEQIIEKYGLSDITRDDVDNTVSGFKYEIIKAVLESED